ncbi:hypothetical protein PVAP13_8NG173801 [Panicum virgatum]|uniref:Uncharacterized protein n=1 Tax=Panicum virgatum TaxID=38727 RepID=A0A8T0P4L7_PANVG|nr:hypothetical protein PVAP13_8NG173801 [Panicum virgatum]
MGNETTVTGFKLYILLGTFDPEHTPSTLGPARLRRAVPEEGRVTSSRTPLALVPYPDWWPAGSQPSGKESYGCLWQCTHTAED